MIVSSRRKPILVFNVVLIIASLLSIYDDFNVICFGRLLFGFANGVLLAAAPKIIEETVPVNIQDYGFGTSTNVMINIGIMINFILGTLVPTETETQKAMNICRVVYLSPFPFALVAIIMHLFFHKNESLSFHI